jgi:hypothetical protein
LDIFLSFTFPPGKTCSPTIHASNFWQFKDNSLIFRAFKLPPCGKTGKLAGKAGQLFAKPENILVRYQYAFTFEVGYFQTATRHLTPFAHRGPESPCKHMNTVSRLGFLHLSRTPVLAMTVPASAAQIAAPANILPGYRLLALR